MKTKSKQVCITKPDMRSTSSPYKCQRHFTFLLLVTLNKYCKSQSATKITKHMSGQVFILQLRSCSKSVVLRYSFLKKLKSHPTHLQYIHITLAHTNINIVLTHKNNSCLSVFIPDKEFGGWG